MKSVHTAGALAVAAALAVPAVATAHPSVYTDSARVLANPNDPNSGVEQTRHVVTNHGFTFVLRETNVLEQGTHKGVFDYSRLPSAYRKTLTWPQLQAEGGTAAQAHATCQVGALETEAAIKAWQDADPFYNYVPFQKTAAGHEDDPARWIPVVQELTGVNLASVADPKAACEQQLLGTYTPADETQTTTANLNSGYLEHETAPLTAQIASLTASLTDMTTARNTLQGMVDAAKAELAKLATPMQVTLPSARTTRAALGKGTSITVTGAAGAPVKARLSVWEGQARKLRLKSSVLASAKATLGADGKATVVLTPKAATREALEKLGRSIAMKATVTSGDRIVRTTGTLAR
jgi:hypothetical protein